MPEGSIMVRKPKVKKSGAAKTAEAPVSKQPKIDTSYEFYQLTPTWRRPKTTKRVHESAVVAQNQVKQKVKSSTTTTKETTQSAKKPEVAASNIVKTSKPSLDPCFASPKVAIPLSHGQAAAARPDSTRIPPVVESKGNSGKTKKSPKTGAVWSGINNPATTAVEKEVLTLPRISSKVALSSVGPTTNGKTPQPSLYDEVTEEAIMANFYRIAAKFARPSLANSRVAPTPRVSAKMSPATASSTAAAVLPEAEKAAE
jgi:hypothetical protein